MDRVQHKSGIAVVQKRQDKAQFSADVIKCVVFDNAVFVDTLADGVPNCLDLIVDRSDIFRVALDLCDLLVQVPLN